MSLLPPTVKTIQGKSYAFCNALFAYELGYITAAEYASTKAFECWRIYDREYVPKMIYENDVYKGCTRENENLIDSLYRLKLVR